MILRPWELYAAALLPRSWIGTDAQGAAYAFPAVHDGWAQREHVHVAYPALSARQLRLVPSYDAIGTGWPGVEVARASVLSRQRAGDVLLDLHDGALSLADSYHDIHGCMWARGTPVLSATQIGGRRPGTYCTEVELADGRRIRLAMHDRWSPGEREP